MKIVRDALLAAERRFFKQVKSFDELMRIMDDVDRGGDWVYVVEELEDGSFAHVWKKVYEEIPRGTSE